MRLMVSGEEVHVRYSYSVLCRAVGEREKKGFFVGAMLCDPRRKKNKKKSMKIDSHRDGDICHPQSFLHCLAVRIHIPTAR